MAKIVGIGETVTDFIIRDGKPEDMVCGGSCFNSIISVGRCGIEAAFIGEVGDDRLGLLTRHTLERNGVNADYLLMTKGKKSQLSLAFLNERNDAEYVFYKDHTSDIFPSRLPRVESGDVLLYGSFFALNPMIHDQLSAFVNSAQKAGAIIYYDINFRSSHLAERERVEPCLLDNMAKASIVRGSDEDFHNFFGLDNESEIYNKVSPYCPNLIVTRGSGAVSLLTPNLRKDYAVSPVPVVSTVGAGDSFNAGIVCSLIAGSVGREALSALPEAEWDGIIATAIAFAQEVCGTTENYIGQATGRRFKAEHKTR